MKTNYKPYVKIYQDGILQNPITKENPYLFGKQKSIRPRFRVWSIIRNNFFAGKTIIKQ